MSDRSLGAVPRLGLWAWTFVGIVASLAITVIALAAVSEIVLPLVFAAVLAVVFRPMVGRLRRHGLKPSLAAGVVVLGLLGLVTVTFVATVRGVVDQAGQIGASVDAATDEVVAELDVDRVALEEARAEAEGLAPALGGGFLTEILEGVDTLVGLASGLILGALIAYYLLKDGSRLRRSVVAQFAPASRGDVDAFVADACRILRDYGRGRTVMSAMVSVVIGVTSLLLGLPLVFTIMLANFLGGYIPYIGAFLGGTLAVVVALGEGGLGAAGVMLVVVVAANLLLENFVEPKVMGRTLHMHPLLVLVVTALGGLVGGIVGLVLAVPVAAIAGSGLARLRSANRAPDGVERELDRVLD